jgi:quinol-cytochrome oxidoreductase complex cytochrome b subunit
VYNLLLQSGTKKTKTSSSSSSTYTAAASAASAAATLVFVEEERTKLPKKNPKKPFNSIHSAPRSELFFFFFFFFFFISPDSPSFLCLPAFSASAAAAALKYSAQQ